MSEFCDKCARPFATPDQVLAWNRFEINIDIEHCWRKNHPQRGWFECEEIYQRLAKARRVSALIERWKTEDVSGEPEWKADGIERMRFK